MKKYSKILSMILIISIISPGLAQATPESMSIEKEIVKRLFGNTRIDTAIKVSDKVYPQGSENVVLAGKNSQVDALTGSLLAAKLQAPLLMIGDLDFDIVEAQLKKLGAENIYLLGGNAAISKEIENSLIENSYKVKRVWGDNRVKTAVEVAKELASTSNHVFLTNDGHSGSLADALAVGPAAGKNQDAILLTSKDKVPETTMESLKDFKITKVTIIGGEKVVSKAVVRQLEKLGIRVIRLAGDNRETTAIKIAKKFFPDSKKVIVVNDGRVSFADALVGGYLGAKEQMPILLTRSNKLDKNTKEYLLAKIDFAYVLGGKNVIDEPIFTTIKKILKGEYVEEEIPQKPQKPVYKPKTIKIQTRGLVFNTGMASDQIRLLKDFFRKRKATNVSKGYIYDNSTKKLVKDYQKSKGLKADGIAGKSTLDKMNQETKDKAYSIGLYIPHTNNKGDMIIVNKSSNTLYLMRNGVVQASYPVATGKTESLTPNGKFKIVVKFKNPTWGGAGISKPVAGGLPNNPLGTRWIGISHGGGGKYGVHGNANPSSIGTYASLGCVRMFNGDVEKLYEKVKTGIPIWIGNERQLMSYGVKFKSNYEKENPQAKFNIQSSEKDLNLKRSLINEDSRKYYSFEEITEFIDDDITDNKEIPNNMEALGGYEVEFIPKDDL